jgi:hypothetical protein
MGSIRALSLTGFRNNQDIDFVVDSLIMVVVVQNEIG